MAEDYRQIKDWLEISVNMLNEASAKEKVDSELEKTDNKLMQMKLDKLNLLIKQRYYEKDEEMDESKMFQFHFDDRGDYYQFTMPLTVLFGKKTTEFAAKYWDDFFSRADIDVDFDDNIRRALRKAGDINLTMKINKKVTKEFEEEE